MRATADEALERLKRGNQRFVANEIEAPRRDGGRRKETAGGQSPYAAVLACADSRVVPELAFDAGLGDLFTVGVAGNIANPSSVASLEFAVTALGARLIVVMGHESCGAVKAALGGGDAGKNLNHLLGFVQLGECSEVDDAACNNARRNAERLIEDSEILRKAVAEDGLKIVPALYRLESGQVDFI
jgi:carbonic anhydrase